MPEKIYIKVIDSLGSSEIPVGIPNDWTIEKFILRLKEKMNYPKEAAYEAELVRTNTILDPQKTIKDLDIQNNDIIRLRAVVVGGCFPKGTKVMISLDKTNYIEDINIGDNLLSWSEKERRTQTSKVKKIYKGSCNCYYIINDQLSVTATHLLYANNGWKRVMDLRINDILMTPFGETPVQSLKLIHKPSTIYNFEIEHNETFFAENILVHNLSEKVKYDEMLKENIKSSLKEPNNISENLIERLTLLAEKEELYFQKRLAIFYLFTMYTILIVCTLSIIFLQGFNIYGFNINDDMLKWLGVSILGEVAGLAALVYGSLFKTKKE